MRDVYILDPLYRRITVVDNYESLIWTERHKAYGDFKLTVASTVQNRSRLTVGTKLAIKDSYRVMEIKTLENAVDVNGIRTLTLTGPSMEEVLANRVARGVMDDLTDTPKWTLTGTPGEIVRQIFHDICITGILQPGDVIPNVTEASIFTTDTIPEPDDDITVEMDPTTVYQAIQEICNQYPELGFRLVRNGDSSQLYWDVYTGSNRTTQQTSLPAVVFSPDLDNLQNVTELTSILPYKNVAYVFTPVGYEIVYALDIDPEISGFDRRVMFVKADDITDEDPAVATARAIQRGKDELAKNRNYSAFDGELNEYGGYRYGTNVNLGDLVEMRNSDGATNQMQVTEWIFVSDSEGDRSYPTLTLNNFITVGAWGSWDYNKVWMDYDGSPTTWSEQP